MMKKMIVLPPSLVSCDHNPYLSRSPSKSGGRSATMRQDAVLGQDALKGVQGSLGSGKGVFTVLSGKRESANHRCW